MTRTVPAGPVGRTLAVVACLCLLPAPAAAQEAASGEVVLDQWFELFQAGRKVGWEHLVIRELPDGGYSLHETRTVPAPEGELVVTTRVETNGSGLLLEASRQRRSPHGESRMTVARAEDGRITWRGRIRELDPRETSFGGGNLRSEWIVAWLAARTAEPGDTRTYRTVSLDTGEVERHRLEVGKEADGVRVEIAEGAVYRFDADGHLVRSGEPGFGTESHAVTEAEARDMERTRPLPESSPHAGDRIRAAGHPFALRDPGPGWAVVLGSGPGTESGLMHFPSQLILMLRSVPFSPTGSEEDRVEIGRRIARDTADTPMAMVDPRPVEFRGEPAIRLDVRGRIGQLPITGEVVIVPAGSGGLMMNLLTPRDLWDDLEAERTTAFEHLELVEPEAPAEPAGGSRTTVRDLGLSFVRPEGWTLSRQGPPQWHFVSPDGESFVGLAAYVIPDDQDPETFQEDLLRRIRLRFPGTEDAGDDETTIDGRTFRRVRLITSMELQGQPVEMEVVSYFHHAGRRTTWFWTVESERAEIPGQVDEVLSSIRWLEDSEGGSR